MTGIIDITLQTPQITYALTLSRNITVVRGDSGSGKSYLCELIEQAASGMEDVLLTLSRQVDYLVLPRSTQDARVSRSWQEIIKSCTDTIIFIDETCDCWKSGLFSKEIQGTSNYYVIFSRSAHTELPYSAEAILYFDKDNSDIVPHVYANKLYPKNELTKIIPQLIITEDEKAGYAFFNKAYTIPVVSAKSKTRVVKKLKDLSKQNKNDIFIIVDGAAFGPEIEKVQSMLTVLFSRSYVYMPESFEWLLLHSPVFQNVHEINDILINYLNEIDWSIYFSAERYFTAKLTELTKQLSLTVYDKSIESLDVIFLRQDTINSVKKIIPIQCAGESAYFS